MADAAANVARRGGQLALFAALALACAGTPPMRSPEPASPAAPEAEATAARAATAQAGENEAPLDKPEVFALRVEGFEPAVVVLPGGKRRKRPMLIAAHGAGDVPEYHCELWSEIVAGRGVVICPRGMALRAGSPHGFYFPNHNYLDQELTAILRAAKSALGDRVDDGPVVYAGYSQGATMGALVAHRYPELFSRLVLIEGGTHEWNMPTAAKFRRGGGERVLLVCGQGGCARVAKRSAQYLSKAGVQARAEYAERAGHTYLGAVAERVRDNFDWVIEGDARWTAR